MKETSGILLLRAACVCVCERWIVGKVYISFCLFVGNRIFQPMKHSFTCKKISVCSLNKKECVGACNRQQDK